MYLIPIHLFEFIEKGSKHEWMGIQATLKQSHFQKWKFMMQGEEKKFAIAIYTMWFYLCACACALVHNCIHSKNILNTDLLQAKIKMSWERNKSSAKLDCSFVAHSHERNS